MRLFCKNTVAVTLYIRSFVVVIWLWTYYSSQTYFLLVGNITHGSTSPVLTATSFVNGKWQFSTPYRIDTHQPITKNLSYVGDPYGCAKLGAHPSTGASARKGEIQSFYGRPIGQAVIFCSCGFFFLLSFYFFPCLFSAVSYWMSTITLHMMWP